MSKSSFQFTNPSLERIDYSINKDFDPNNQESISIEIKTDFNIQKSDDGKEAMVSLNLIVGSRESNVPFYIDATESACFKWEEDNISGVDVDQLLRRNATSLLISYLRPIVSFITAASNYPAYHLPFINLKDEG